MTSADIPPSKVLSSKDMFERGQLSSEETMRGYNTNGEQTMGSWIPYGSKITQRTAE
jgi:hypothetical protein